MQKIRLAVHVQDLQGAGSVQEVHRLHRSYLEAVARPCMGSGDATWLLIHSVLRKLLDLCLRFHELLPDAQVCFLSQLPQRLPLPVRRPTSCQLPITAHACGFATHAK